MLEKLDINIMARKKAMHHIQQAVDAGSSENDIALTWHCGGRSHKFWADAADGFGGYECSVGGWYDYDNGTGLARKKVNNDKILVTEVCGVEGVWIYSLHEIYVECKKGQLTLI